MVLRIRTPSSLNSTVTDKSLDHCQNNRLGTLPAGQDVEVKYLFESEKGRHEIMERYKVSIE